MRVLSSRLKSILNVPGNSNPHDDLACATHAVHPLHRCAAQYAIPCVCVCAMINK